MDLSADVDIMEHSISDLNLVSATDANWRNNMQTLRSKLEYALKNGILSDLVCIVGTGDNKEEISCHSLILRLHSRTFDKKFLKSDSSGRVELPKYEPRIFHQFLLVQYSQNSLFK